MSDYMSQDQRNMQAFGFIYADGSYSDERLPKGATLVPRRPGPSYKWDFANKRWVDTAVTAVKAAEPVKEAAPAPVIPPAAEKKEAPAVQAAEEFGGGLAEMLKNTTTPEGA
jgi:hypothetical protein